MLATPGILGKQGFKRFEALLEMLDASHREHMGDKPHWYCWMIATNPQAQGQGYAKALMRHTFAQADAAYRSAIALKPDLAAAQ